ncbi:conserved hypothetical protein [Sulfolobus islandicus Y.G.57.14]|jgi:hypothetical protein|uniref:Uncharacterized protein n=4 Tax=Saccharolobus islandicus TaxID=43080 RepID=C3MP89_SACI2|nr:hypothetical protein [Sulfolobus islandicus]ACP35202.1 conserved hypothetical protein [Sulfolobus islandicus L.S.2.15]ACP45355.1 conserved hypothetical protein [Sulfolobus islandicus Y.G.57.14]ACP48843.1 conserved hypothetical protein [Sulfolobus islandicus Y.N.15.51]ADB86883.1 conserved hypothetical protein [Sulfolobus islandicus L.D.8.5]PVU78194.1 hypothetical protein DDW12_03555 [Sulfolobus islandicus]
MLIYNKTNIKGFYNNFPIFVIEMCEFKVVTVERPIRQDSNIVLIDYYDFVKISDTKIMNVLVKDSRENYSKSYYYYIRDYLNKLRILKENMINVKLVFPFEKANGSLNLKKGIIYVTNDKQVVYMNLHSNVYTNCENCIAKPFCTYYLAKIVGESRLKIGVNKGNPGESWDKAISSLQSKYVKSKVIELPPSV